MMGEVFGWITSEQFWLPQGVSWSQLHSETSVNTYPKPGDLLVIIPISLVLVIIQAALEKFFSDVFGSHLGVPKTKYDPPTDNVTLWHVYKTSTVRPSTKHMNGIAQHLGWNQKDVKMWFRQARAANKPSTMEKFKNSCWQLTFQLFVLVYGLVILTKAPFFWNTPLCFLEYPKIPLLSSIAGYYMLHLSFYTSSLLVMLQKGSVHMEPPSVILHHCVVLGLLLVSYIMNFTRIGALVIFYHDLPKCLIEVSKLLHYLKFSWLSTGVLFCHTVTFFITRLGIFPFCLFSSIIVEIPETFGTFPAFWLALVMLLVLQILNIYWFQNASHTLTQLVRNGKVEKDNEESIFHNDSDDSADEHSHNSNSDKPVAPEEPNMNR